MVEKAAAATEATAEAVQAAAEAAEATQGSAAAAPWEGVAAEVCRGSVAAAAPVIAMLEGQEVAEELVVLASLVVKQAVGVVAMAEPEAESRSTAEAEAEEISEAMGASRVVPA
jgi:hypothetical protein